MQRQTLIAILSGQLLCLSFFLVWFFSYTQTTIIQAQVITPEPFLGPIFYAQESVWQIFDHDLPLGGNPLFSDGNDYVTHYNGVVYQAVTATPIATAIPRSTATPTTTPGPPPYIPDFGYGYDQHGGIDYSLKYKPVLAAASGSVQYAGWDDPSNHRRGYGLRVTLDHTPETLYDTYYGHLSTVVVETGQDIIININDPGSRHHIIGISGNTGGVFGSSSAPCSTIPNGGPLCGQHLHFEVRLSGAGYKPVNPYGWIGGIGTVDPWAVYTPETETPNPSGVTSYHLWATKPAISSAQFGTPGPTITPPPLQDASLVIDNDSADFVTPVY